MKKKLAIMLSVVTITVILLSSCKSAEQCAAYGEHSKYKVESR
jgi:hypothetical protein